MLSSIVAAFTAPDFFKALWDGILQFAIEQGWTEFGIVLTYIESWGTELFELDWIKGAIQLFQLFGWAMFVVGAVLSAFDLAIEYQNGRATIKTTALNILKGFFAASLFCTVPIELYKFTIRLQGIFCGDLSTIFANMQSWDDNIFSSIGSPFLILLCGIIIIYCVIKILFATFKRGGILFIQIAVGSLYMLSIPRGYSDGFNNWVKQVIALCLTTFLQTSMLYLATVTIETSIPGTLCLLLAANEVPRIADRFGMDSSVRMNFHSTLYSASMITNMIRTFSRR